MPAFLNTLLFKGVNVVNGWQLNGFIERNECRDIAFTDVLQQPLFQEFTWRNIHFSSISELNRICVQLFEQLVVLVAVDMKVAPAAEKILFRGKC